MNIYTCGLCSAQLKNTKLLGRHLYYHHDRYDKQAYYDEFLSGPSKCAVCAAPTKFLDLGKGYVKTCSLSCSTKLQWIKDDGSRLQKASKRFSENNIGIPGARKGCKNKHQYPVTEAVMEKNRKTGFNRRGVKKPPHPEHVKNKMSETRLRKIESGEIKIVGPMKGNYTPINHQKYNGDPSRIIYRSSWELKLMVYLDRHPNVLEWSSEEIRVRYLSPIDNRYHTYFPDFLVVKQNRDGSKETILIEVKPKSQTQPPKVQSKATKRYLTEVHTWGVNSAKWDAARAYCRARGWKFLIMTEVDLGIKKL